MTNRTATEVGEPDYQETQRVAGKIEREVAGVLTETSRHEIAVDFSQGHHLPPEAVDIAQSNGYVLHAIFGNSAKFRRNDRT